MANRSKNGSKENAFLGTGWTFPPTFSRRFSSVDMVSGEADIKEALWVLFSTAPGERIMLPTFGCDLWNRVFGNLNTAFKTEVQDAVGQAILRWEPRIDVESVEVYEDEEQTGLLNILVTYIVRRTNSRDNLVYPFYLEEGTLVPAAPER